MWCFFFWNSFEEIPGRICEVVHLRVHEEISESIQLWIFIWFFGFYYKTMILRGVTENRFRRSPHKFLYWHDSFDGILIVCIIKEHARSSDYSVIFFPSGQLTAGIFKISIIQQVSSIISHSVGGKAEGIFVIFQGQFFLQMSGELTWLHNLFL